MATTQLKLKGDNTDIYPTLSDECLNGHVKTLNGQSIVGTGDITITAGGGAR